MYNASDINGDGLCDVDGDAYYGDHYTGIEDLGSGSEGDRLFVARECFESLISKYQHVPGLRDDLLRARTRICGGYV